MSNKRDDFAGFDGRGWICDTCGEPILKAKDGVLEWLSGYNKDGDESVKIARDIHLVHHLPASPRAHKGDDIGCYFNEREEFKKDRLTPSWSHLDRFLDTDGLMELLEILQHEGLPKEDVIEMIKRLHIPGYEHARLHFNEAISNGVFEPNRAPGFYWQSDIEATLKWAEETGSL
jgi:hypothetical protein